MKTTLLIDMDHVMADITLQYLEWYLDKTGVKLERSDLLGKAEDQAFPRPELINDFLHTPGFFRHAKVIQGSQDVIRELNNLFDVFIVSAAIEFPQSLTEKYDWLIEHFPYLNWKQIVFCGSKKCICGDIMIDDHAKNLDNFKGQKLLFSAPHNANINNGDYFRVNDWAAVKSLLISKSSITI